MRAGSRVAHRQWRGRSRPRLADAARFVLLLPLSNVAIWVGLFVTGKITLIGAIASSVVVTAALVGGLVMLIRGRTKAAAGV